MGAPGRGNNSALVINGWALFAHEAFNAEFQRLLTLVEKLASENPHGFHHHPATKVFLKVKNCAFERVPADPSSRDFVGGDAFGTHKHWRRAKHGMPHRYRLYFQFQSQAPKSIIYAWFNSEDTMRKEGAKSDCYATFVRMIESGDIPDSFESLLKASKALTQDSLASPGDR